MDVVTQAHVVQLCEDPGHFLHSFGVNAAQLMVPWQQELVCICEFIFYCLIFFFFAFSCKMCQQVKNGSLSKNTLSLPSGITNIEVIDLIDAVAIFNIARLAMH